MESTFSPLPVKIEKVLELRYHPNATTVYCHVSTPVQDEGKEKRYALIAACPQGGRTLLGDIHPDQGEFREFSREVTFYERASNHVVCQMHIPVAQLESLRTIDNVLASPHVSIVRELIPH